MTDGEDRDGGVDHQGARRGEGLMGANTGIAWTSHVWNPTRGCSRVSPGCGGANHEGGCYAEKMAARFSDPGQWGHGFAERTPHGGRWTGKVELIPEMLDLPLRWKKPRRIFVNSTSDLFHESLPDEVIDRVFAVMALAPQHTFQILTKRAKRMREYLSAAQFASRIWNAAVRLDCENHFSENHPGYAVLLDPKNLSMPLRNCWLGISAEDQQRADDRIPDLLATPAAVRFISAEPLLGPISLGAISNLSSIGIRSNRGFVDALTGNTEHEELRGKPHAAPQLPALDWVIVGGESGGHARAFDLTWARSIRDQCKAAGVAFFMKQLGARPFEEFAPGCDHFLTNLRDRAGADPSEWPSDIRVQEFPEDVKP